jgi:hypothetical protein
MCGAPKVDARGDISLTASDYDQSCLAIIAQPGKPSGAASRCSPHPTPLLPQRELSTPAAPERHTLAASSAKILSQKVIVGRGGLPTERVDTGRPERRPGVRIVRGLALRSLALGSYGWRAVVPVLPASDASV